MPWTFAHPAAVLPFRKIGSLTLPLSGLVVGSLVPDAGYYIGHKGAADFAHTPAGIPLFCLPVAFIIVLLLRRFGALLTGPLPAPHGVALASLKLPVCWPLPAMAQMGLAIVVGAATHLLWDSFTHFNGVAVRIFPGLREELFAVSGRGFPAYNVLQHASTVFGLSVLLLAYWRWLKRVEVPHASGTGARSYIPLLACACSAALVGFSATWFVYGARGLASAFVVTGVIYSTVVFLILYVALAVLARDSAV